MVIVVDSQDMVSEPVIRAGLGKKPCLKRKIKMAFTLGTHMLSLQTPIFSGNNYDYWSLKMKDLFKGQYFWEIVQNGYTEPT